MQLIQIGAPANKKPTSLTIREMFEQMADRERQMILAARMQFQAKNKQ